MNRGNRIYEAWTQRQTQRLSHLVNPFPEWAGLVWLVLAGYLVLAIVMLKLAWRGAVLSSRRDAQLAELLGDAEGRQDSSEVRRQLLGFEETTGDQGGTQDLKVREVDGR
jgi:hypothetical protein